MQHTTTEVRLKNGARGLLIDVPGATVMSFQFQFRAGNRFVQSQDKYETAHIMEHLAFGANSEFKSEHAYEADFTKNGAYHNAYTSDLSMVYIADCADFEWERILRLQQVAICSPKFNNRELEAEKGNVRSELTGYLNNHNRVLWPKVQQLLGEDVYTFWQRIQTINNVTLADIKEHYARTHTAKNLRFIIAGKLDGRKSQIVRMLESWDLETGERFDAPVDEYSNANPTLIRRKEASNLTFAWSMVLPYEITEEETDAMDCLNHILTGTMHSRIYGAARKRGLAYGMFSDTGVAAGTTGWDFGGQVNLETSEDLFKIINRELKKVVDGDVSDEEIESAKSYAIGRHQMGAQTVAQISSFYTSRYFTDGTVKSYDKVPDSIKTISKECMIDTARQFFTKGSWVLAGVSSGEKEDIVNLSDRLAPLFETR